MKKLNLLLVSFICLIQPAFADSITSNIKYALKHSTDTSYLSVIISLLIVILLIYITGIIYAKLNVVGYKTLKKQYKDIEDSKIIIRSTTQVGNNKTLHVIELAGKKMLIGVTNDSINLIKDLDDSAPKQVAANEEVPQSMLAKELSKTLPLDKIYPQEQQISDEINIDKEIPEEKTEEESEYDTEEFGLYKKYLED